MKTLLRLLLPALCLMTVACSTWSVGGSIPTRDGPEFAKAFPDASVLVSTTDVREVRALLETVQLPATKEHHDQLIALVDEAEEFSAQHLLLLTEAVARDPDLSNCVIITSSQNGTTFHWTRGAGEYAHVIDELLLTGAKKVSDPSPKHFGQLLGRTQTKQSLIALVRECEKVNDADDWDDGSASDLQAILEESLIDEIKLELCIDALLPAGRLDEERANVAVRSMAFDGGRKRLLTADYARRSSLSPEELLSHVVLMSFDEARTETVRQGAPLLAKVDGHQVLDLVETAAFDTGKVEMVQALASNIEFQSSPEVIAIVEAAAFDSGKEKILSALAAGSFLKLNGDDLVAFANTAAFDSGRIDILKTLHPHVDSALSADELRQVLHTCAFDSGRRQVVEIFVNELRRLPSSDREQILSCFAFSSDKKEARKILDW